MVKVTQGSIIYGMRSDKYPGVLAYGIVISATCDLIQEKIDKIYYLPGIPVEDWIFTNVGFRKSLSNVEANLENNLRNKCENYGLIWEVMNNLSLDEIYIVLEDVCSNPKEKENFGQIFKKYKQYTNQSLSIKEKKEIISNESKSISQYIIDMTNGKNTQFIFIPSHAFEPQNSIQFGMIIDLQELNFLLPEDVEKLCNLEIDEKVLNAQEKYYYNKRFFIFEDPGFSILQGRLASPWTEYTMQHFSNGFIRIGVDNLKKDEIKRIIEIIFME